MDVDPRRLREFLKIVENGTFTGAAQDLNVSQPALSNSIKILERNLGVKLLNRDRNGARTTEYGNILADSALALEIVLKKAAEKIADRKSGSIGSLAIGVTPIAASGMVPQAVSQLIDQSPDISILIEEGYDDLLIEKLRNMELDLIVGPIGKHRTQPDIHDIELIPDQFCIISRPGNPLIQGKSVTLNKLQNAHWISYPGSGSRFQMEFMFSSIDLPVPTHIINSNSILAIKTLVAESDCIAIMSPQVVAPEKAAGMLKTATLKKTDLLRTIGIRTIKGREQTLVIQRFIDTLKAL